MIGPAPTSPKAAEALEVFNETYEALAEVGGVFSVRALSFKAWGPCHEGSRWAKVFSTAIDGCRYVFLGMA